jgi:EAL and modified HD-GYP domain-containing signal transduction protein
MADVFVARQPIFLADQSLSAYELLFRRGDENRAVISDNEDATSTVIINAFTEFGLETVVGDHRAWINVTREFILNRLAYSLPPERVVLELLENQYVDEKLLEALRELRAEGYTVALDDFSWDEALIPLVQAVDIVKVDVMPMDTADVIRNVNALRPYGVKLVAEKVETREEFNVCAQLGFDLFQGYFFCKPEVLSGRGISPNRLTLLQLVAALQDRNIEFADLETLITRDVALSYRLLRYINSAFFGLRTECSSIGRALTLLGLENVKRWSTMTVFAGLDVKPQELILTALVRARMCELLGPAVGERNDDQSFTLGLFSVIDAMMDAPMEEVLESIPFPDDMRDALVSGEGPKGRLLTCVLDWERGEYDSACGIEPAAVGDAHYDALAWADKAAEQLFDDRAIAA